MNTIKMTLKMTALALMASSSIAFAGEGPNVGGGGYTSKSSLPLLISVSQDLASKIRGSSEIIWGQVLPSGFSKAQFADVIANVRATPTAEKQRDGFDLDFDYGVDERGPYIQALRPYFIKYGVESQTHVRDVQVLLLHEAAHLIGIGQSLATDDQAKAFAQAVLEHLERDLVYCVTDSSNWVGEQLGLSRHQSWRTKVLPEGQPPTVFNSIYDPDYSLSYNWLKDIRSRSWLISRTYGFVRIRDNSEFRGYVQNPDSLHEVIDHIQPGELEYKTLSSYQRRKIDEDLYSYSDVNYKKDLKLIKAEGGLGIEFVDSVGFVDHKFPLDLRIVIADANKTSTIYSAVLKTPALKRAEYSFVRNVLHATPPDYIYGDVSDQMVDSPIKCEILAKPIPKD